MKQLLIKKRVSRWAALLLSLVMLLSVCAVSAFAYERIDTGAGTSLTVNLVDQNYAVPNASFSLYRVADVSDAVEFTLTGGFEGAQIDLEDVQEASTWANYALTLEGYAGANSIAPVATAATDENGQATFSGLSVGLYLLVGEKLVDGDYTYTISPSLIALPTLQTESDTWNYNPAVQVKVSSAFNTEYTSVTVKKVWSDGSYKQRPDSVSIQLLQDGKVIDTVTLNAANNWTYTWKDLTSTYAAEYRVKKAYTYTVNESSVPTGYTVAVSQNDTTYTVTNTRPVEKDKKLPQTGTLNWPIPVLTIAGLLLVGAGWYLFSRKKDN